MQSWAMPGSSEEGSSRIPSAVTAALVGKKKFSWTGVSFVSLLDNKIIKTYPKEGGGSDIVVYECDIDEAPKEHLSSTRDRVLVRKFIEDKSATVTVPVFKVADLIKGQANILKGSQEPVYELSGMEHLLASDEEDVTRVIDDPKSEMGRIAEEVDSLHKQLYQLEGRLHGLKELFPEAKELEGQKKLSRKLKLDKMRMNGVKARLAMRTRIAEEGGFVGTKDLSEYLNISRPTVAAWRRDGKLLGIPQTEKNMRYPAFQLWGDHVIKGFREALAILLPKFEDRWIVADYFLRAYEAIGRRRPIDLLRDESENSREEVVEHAKSYCEQGG